MADYRRYTSSIQALVARVDQTSTYAAKIANVIALMGTSVAALIDLNANPNPTLTEAANFKKVQDGARKLEAQRVAALASINAIMREGAGDAQRRMDEKVKLVPNTKYEAEIRSVYRSLSSSEKIVFLRDMAVTNNGPALASVTEVGNELTGISKEMAEQFRTLILQTHAAGELKDTTDLMAALDPAFVALDVVKEVVAAFSDPYRLASIRQGEALAEAAEQKLNAAFV